jgi:hypothetical protein
MGTYAAELYIPGVTPEQLLDTARRAKGGFLVEIAITIHDGIAYVFTFQNPAGSGGHNADRAAFRKFLAGVRFQR